jgi:hypothetical protein
MYWLATPDEAPGLVLDYEKVREATGSRLAIYGNDEGRAVIMAMADSMNTLFRCGAELEDHCVRRILSIAFPFASSSTILSR